MITGGGFQFIQKKLLSNHKEMDDIVRKPLDAGYLSLHRLKMKWLFPNYFEELQEMTDSKCSEELKNLFYYWNVKIATHLKAASCIFVKMWN